MEITHSWARNQSGAFILKSTYGTQQAERVYLPGQVPYGVCPQCYAPGKSRDRSPDGNTTCINGHVRRSIYFIEPPASLTREKKVPKNPKEATEDSYNGVKLPYIPTAPNERKEYMLKVMQHAGSVIHRLKDVDEVWEEVKIPSWNWEEYAYAIMPEAKPPIWRDYTVEEFIKTFMSKPAYIFLRVCESTAFISVTPNASERAFFFQGPAGRMNLAEAHFEYSLDLGKTWTRYGVEE